MNGRGKRPRGADSRNRDAQGKPGAARAAPLPRRSSSGSSPLLLTPPSPWPPPRHCAPESSRILMRGRGAPPAPPPAGGGRLAPQRGGALPIARFGEACACGRGDSRLKSKRTEGARPPAYGGSGKRPARKGAQSPEVTRGPEKPPCGAAGSAPAGAQGVL